jgi:transcriptional activator of cad operon
MPTGNSDGAVQIGEWIANPSRDTLSKGTETQKLEPRTMRLLMCLANSAGEVKEPPLRHLAGQRVVISQTAS